MMKIISLFNNRANIVEFVLFPAIITAAFLFLKSTGTAGVPWMEFTLVMLTLIAMPMLKRENPWGQIVSFVAQILFVYYFLGLDLIGQAIFGAVWAVLNLIGFYNWLRSADNKKKKPASARLRRDKPALVPSFLQPIWLVAILAGAAMVVWVSSAGGIINVLDYSILYFGIAGQVVLTKKKTDGWTLWIVTSVAGIILFWKTGLYLLLLRSIAYLFIYITAFVKWSKKNGKSY